MFRDFSFGTAALDFSNEGYFLNEGKHAVFGNKYRIHQFEDGPA
jgi:hypothetical protein